MVKSGSSAMAAMTLLKICSSWSEMDTIKSFPILCVSPPAYLYLVFGDFSFCQRTWVFVVVKLGY